MVKNNLKENYITKTEFYEFKEEFYEFKEEFYEFKKEVNLKFKEIDNNFKKVFKILEQHTKALLSIENTLKVYGDMYKLNKENNDRLLLRVETIEDKLLVNNIV